MSALPTFVANERIYRSEFTLMEPYILSLLAGLLAGVIYSIIRVRSPAPPIVALVGLLGMVIGVQLIPFGRQILMSLSS